jgi:hypothetical protein
MSHDVPLCKALSDVNFLLRLIWFNRLSASFIAFVYGCLQNMDRSQSKVHLLLSCIIKINENQYQRIHFYVHNKINCYKALVESPCFLQLVLRNSPIVQ